MSFTNHVLRITDFGRTLEINGNTFDLSAIRPMIIVETNGTSTLQERTVDIVEN